MSTVKISRGNSKMGNIPSVSLPAITTCRTCNCMEKCYAYKLERLRPNVRESYLHNYSVLTKDPDVYWREVEAAIMTSRFFRFHVSGDIPSPDYLDHMIDIAKRNRHCEILCFTKRYNFVNERMVKDASIPLNLHIIFSHWIGLEMENPFSFPVAYVRYKNGMCFAPENAVPCEGNCTACAITDKGCWKLSLGESVVFDEH